MRHLFILLILPFNIIQSSAQTTNTKAGLWSDNSIWNSNSIPGESDVIILSFDVTVDINAICKSINANGHNVIVNPGVHLNIVGVNSDQQLSWGLLAHYPLMAVLEMKVVTGMI